MGTYVQLTRQEFEDWLDDQGFRGKWKTHDQYGGVYALPLSDAVAISINSTTGSGTSVRDKGRASMKMRLVSRITNKVLLGPVKLSGKSHFKRTLNWRSTWGKGLERAKQTYNSSRSFYDAIAEIENRDQYKADMLAKIESQPNWEDNDFLKSLRERLMKGGVLTVKQKAALERTPQSSARPQYTQEDIADLVLDLRALWVVLDDEEQKGWVAEVAKRVKSTGKWTRPEGNTINGLLRQYRREIEQARRSDSRLKRTSATRVAARHEHRRIERKP